MYGATWNFFGFLEKDKQISILEKFVDSLKESLIEFNLFEEEARKKQVDDSLKTMAIFQFKTLEYGIDKITEHILKLNSYNIQGVTQNIL